MKENASVLESLNALGAAARVRFIIDSGTLLGLHRDGRILHWDTDLDIAVLGVQDVEAVQRALPRGTFSAWRFRRYVYKLRISATVMGVSLPVDLKVFDLSGNEWISPSVGAGVGRSSPSSGWRGWFRPVWQWYVGLGDAARFPLRHLVRVDHWAVPRPFFEKTRAWSEDLPFIQVPVEIDAYLSFRYGDWHTPVKDWCYWRDDGAFVSAPPP